MRYNLHIKKELGKSIYESIDERIAHNTKKNQFLLFLVFDQKYNTNIR